MKWAEFVFIGRKNKIVVFPNNNGIELFCKIFLMVFLHFFACVVCVNDFAIKYIYIFNKCTANMTSKPIV